MITSQDRSQANYNHSYPPCLFVGTISHNLTDSWFLRLVEMITSQQRPPLKTDHNHSYPPCLFLGTISHNLTDPVVPATGGNDYLSTKTTS